MKTIDYITVTDSSATLMTKGCSELLKNPESKLKEVRTRLELPENAPLLVEPWGSPICYLDPKMGHGYGFMQAFIVKQVETEKSKK